MPESGRGSGFRSPIQYEHREAHWRKVLAEAASSSLSKTDFCRTRGIKLTTYFWWKREIARRDAGVRRARNKITAPSTPISLVPVRLIKREEPERPSPIEVVLEGGHTIRVFPGFDPDTFRRVVAVLEESC